MIRTIHHQVIQDNRWLRTWLLSTVLGIMVGLHATGTRLREFFGGMGQVNRPSNVLDSGYVGKSDANHPIAGFRPGDTLWRSP